MIKPYLLSLPLVLTYGGIVQNKKIASEPLALKKNRPAKVYWPEKKNKTLLPGIYLQHGLSVRGIGDQRLIDLAENLAYCGYTVAVPELAEVKSLIMTTDTIDHIEEVGLELSENNTWYDRERFGFFSMSFSSGMGLVACSRPRLAPRVSSLMAVGGYCDFIDTFPFVFENFHLDNYGVMILLFNLIEKLEPDLAADLRPVFYEAAVDNALVRKGENALAPKLLAKTKKASLAFYDLVINSKEFRFKLAGNLQNCFPADLPKAFSPLYQMGGLKSPVALLHGDSDPVISPTESQKLADYFKDKGHKYIFRTSSALTHGDNLPLSQQIPGIPGLLATFGSFFQWLKD